MPGRASGARTSPSASRTLEECSHCHEMKLPHHVCPNCGYYHGRLAVQPKPPQTTPRADDGDRAASRRRRAAAAGFASRSTPWAATTGRRGRPGRPRSRRGSSRRSGDPGRRRTDDPCRSRAPCLPNVSIVHASQVIGMDEHPALALREKKDASILVAIDLVKNGEADAVVTAGHTGAGMAAAVLRLGRLPGVDRPALAVQMVTATGRWCCSTSAPTPTRRPRTSPSTRGWARSSPSACWASPSPRVALLSIGEEKGKGDARIQRATELLDASDLRFVGNVEGKDLTAPPGRRRRLRRGPGQRRDQVLRGPLDVHLRPVARASSGARCAAASRTSCCAGRRPGSGTSSTTRRSAARRCSGCAGRSSSPTAERSGGWSAFACEVAATTARTGSRR